MSHSQGPLQDRLGQSTGLASHSQGPPQDHLGQFTVSAKCPPQDSPQPQASTSGPSQDPWSILGSSESAIAPVRKVPAVSPAASSVMMPFVEPLLPDKQRFSYQGVNAHFHPDKMLEEWPQKTLLESINFTPEAISFHLDQAFPCFAFPESWPDPDTLTLPQQINRFALGWHPTRTSKFFQDPHHKWRNLFMQLQQHSAMTALGKIVLDYERAK